VWARKEALAKEMAMREDDDAFTVRCNTMDDMQREQMANSKVGWGYLKPVLKPPERERERDTLPRA